MGQTQGINVVETKGLLKSDKPPDPKPPRDVKITFVGAKIKQHRAGGHSLIMIH